MDSQLAQAQKFYRALVSGQKPEMTPMLVRFIDDNLKKLRLDYSHLDPASGRSHKEIFEQVRGISDAYHIGKARRVLANMQRGGTIDLLADHVRSTLEKELNAAGVGYAALDPTGERSDKEMRGVVDEAMRGMHLRLARKQYGDLWNGFARVTPASAQELKDSLSRKLRGDHIKQLHQHLAKGDWPLSALPLQPGHSDAEVQAVLRSFARHEMPLVPLALEHAAGWQNLAAIAAKQAENGIVLDKEALQQPYDHPGRNLLVLAAQRGVFGFVVPYLNRRGERIGTHDLLDGEQPNRLLATLIEKNQLSTLMREKNWLGQPVGELQKLYAHLPPEGKEQFTGYHSLATLMREHEQSQRGIGR